MKVVLFCGGFGMRVREFAENTPKPLVCIGRRPILWNVMKYYAHFGHKEFILCLGWKSEAIKDYFLNYNECLTNDFVLADGKVDLLHSDIHDWQITFVDTGTQANVGQRLLAVRSYLNGDEVFLANYADGLSDLPLPQMIDYFYDRRATATFVAVRPHQTWHTVDFATDGAVQDIQPINNCNTWMNGGFFVFNRRIFDVLEEGEELVLEPFQRLIARQELFALKYDGFWSCLDTFKDKQWLDDLLARGQAPWEVWRGTSAAGTIETSDGLAASELIRSRPH